MAGRDGGREGRLLVSMLCGNLMGRMFGKGKVGVPYIYREAEGGEQIMNRKQRSTLQLKYIVMNYQNYALIAVPNPSFNARYQQNY